MAAASGFAVGGASIEQSVAEEPPARAAMIGPQEERAGASMVASPMSLDLLCAGFAKVP